jgi:MFS superfamily sulfate permease-like transporter
LAAIDIILVSKQIPLTLGYDQPDFWSGGLIQLFSTDHFLGNIETFSHHITRGAILITLISLAVLILLQQPFAKKLKSIPAPLLVVVIGIIVNFLFIA